MDLQIGGDEDEDESVDENFDRQFLRRNSPEGGRLQSNGGLMSHGAACIPVYPDTLPSSPL